jgi:hypothetical protein
VALDVDAPSVQSHLAMLQGIVARLAANCASCKTWCVSLVSAIAVVAVQSKSAQLLFVVVIPLVLFAILDSYYLGMERRFRDCYERFVRNLHSGVATVDDVFIVSPRLEIRGFFGEAIEAFGSFSIWPFYLGLAAVVYLLGLRLLG